MKHKKLIIIIAVAVIMATFTISTFAEVPTEAVTGYYITYNDAGNGISNSYTASILFPDAPENIEFFMVGEDYYFIDVITANEGDYITANVIGTGNLSQITIDIIDNGANSSPDNVIVYWSSETVPIAESNYADEITKIDEVTYTPPVETNNIYADIYDMIQQYIFGGDELLPEEALITTLIAMTSCILITLLPFYILLRIIFKFV